MYDCSVLYLSILIWWYYNVYLISKVKVLNAMMKLQGGAIFLCCTKTSSLTVLLYYRVHQQFNITLL